LFNKREKREPSVKKINRTELRITKTIFKSNRKDKKIDVTTFEMITGFRAWTDVFKIGKHSLNYCK
jgi:hypothetical protein